MQRVSFCASDVKYGLSQPREHAFSTFGFVFGCMHLHKSFAACVAAFKFCEEDSWFTWGWILVRHLSEMVTDIIACVFVHVLAAETCNVYSRNILGCPCRTWPFVRWLGHRDTNQVLAERGVLIL